MTDNRTNEPTPERWRKKPVEIEARRFSGAMELIDAEGLALWCGGTFKHDTGAGQEYKSYYWSIEIPTLEGTMRATPGDYIIKGVQGEFYPCKPDIFEQTYEPAALVAAQGTAPQAESKCQTCSREASFCAHCVAEMELVPVLPSSGVDEDKLAEVIESEIDKLRHETRLYPDIYKTQVARAVAEWLKGQER